MFALIFNQGWQLEKVLQLRAHPIPSLPVCCLFNQTGNTTSDWLTKWMLKFLANFFLRLSLFWRDLINCNELNCLFGLAQKGYGSWRIPDPDVLDDCMQQSTHIHINALFHLMRFALLRFLLLCRFSHRVITFQSLKSKGLQKGLWMFKTKSQTFISCYFVFICINKHEWGFVQTKHYKYILYYIWVATNEKASRNIFWDQWNGTWYYPWAGSKEHFCKYYSKNIFSEQIIFETIKNILVE